MLRTAAHYAASNADQCGSRIAVNVSALQLRGQDIAATYAAPALIDPTTGG